MQINDFKHRRSGSLMKGTIGHSGAKKNTGHGPARTKKQRRTYRKRRDLRSPGQKVYSNPQNQVKEKTGAKPGKKRTPGPSRGGPKTRLVNQPAKKKRKAQVRRRTLLWLVEGNGVWRGHREAPHNGPGVLAIQSNRQPKLAGTGRFPQ